MSENVEVLQPSSLEDYEWPKEDPHSVPQPTRSMLESDLDLLKACLNSAEININEFRKNVRQERLSEEATVLKILSHRKFQMNPVTSVRNEERWIKSVEYAMNNKKPIEIVYPQFCVIPNAPKRYTNTGTAAGEDCTIMFFKLINRHVKEFYSPGVRFHILSDASLYASAFQTHQTEVNAYYECLRNRVETLGASDCVFLYDYAELLRTKCEPDYTQHYYSIGQKVWVDPLEKHLPTTDIETLRRSVRCSVNTRRFQLTHKDHYSLFGPIKARDNKHPFYDVIEKLTDVALREVTTIRLACGKIDISSRLWPNAIRASCHKGQKNGRWPIGQKVYPEYYGRCKLLPYHGMPIIYRGENGKLTLEITPEVLLRGRTDLVRITFEEKDDEVYAYVARDVDENYNGDIEYKYPIGMRAIEFQEE
ncbi:MAG: hypothetical protein FP824_06125 [Euryarchaeota archaeon]|nr:hypothetical protein [Euryarchaeota archaeon]MBU4032952.1 L-tyrosine/L-tryptophan isonitrile synthase family protein [Candidatus Thermoplasmatota archaeon]MBU4144252.1 L-tyrosine/L-tryptophan isonitrile synthase family protein [Candidatus Thermoplasmatota archaeon]